VGPRAGLDSLKNFAPIGIRSPDRPARSQSLCRLSLPAHLGACETLKPLIQLPIDRTTADFWNPTEQSEK